ncbi:MAG TPA: amidohydrolase family protein [Candidatus Binatia bacterium]|nr:amidohydrolase family protein [Candidatus Binatia bacterium]
MHRRWDGRRGALRGGALSDAPDLVVRGGTVVDGSGRAPFTADVVVRGDRIVGLGRHDGTAREVIDARGLLVTPGFVDVHTHLDAQLTWDPAATISTAHGVTAVVVGNCGVGFAPCRARDRDYLTFLMEGVEDIPRAAIAAGMRWRWETFPEYLTALAAGGLGPNVGAYAAHAPLRVFTMGERGATEATPSQDELAAMRHAVADALAAGALGVSTGRTTMHRTPAGDAVPGTFADREELLALAEPLGRLGAGVFQVIPYGAAGEAAGGYARDHDLLVEIARRIGRPVSVGLAQVRQYPEVWRSALDAIATAAGAGARIVPQVAPRSIGLVLGFGGLLSPLLLFPAAGDLVGRPEVEVLAALGDPAVRARLAASLDPGGEIMAGLATLDRVFPLEDRGVLAYETDRARSVVGLAEAAGTTPGAVILERLVASELRALFLVALYNPDLEAAGAMLAHPLSVPGLGDAGAHTSQTCDVGVPTFILAYWVRHRGALPLPAAVRKLTFEAASTWGIALRGLVRPGWYADLNVIDLGRLDLTLPEVRHDLPGGATNLVQRARGYVATIVNGQVVMRDGISTGALPGRVLRNEAAAPN